MRGGRAGQRTEIGRCTGTSTAHTGIFQAEAETFGMESPGRISRGDCARSGRACKFPLPIFAKISQNLQIFGGLVLGCIKTKFCKKIGV